MLREARIPDWIVAKKTFPAGIRMPKRSKWYDAENHKGAFEGGWPIFPRQMNEVRAPQIGDALLNGDLRFWNGIDWKQSYATCRSCGEVIHFAKERKAHLKEAGCGSRITRAINLLSRSNRCVVCDEETKRKMWGIPMCAKECQSEWAWLTKCPPALRAALDLVERETKAKTK